MQFPPRKTTGRPRYWLVVVAREEDEIHAKLRRVLAADRHVRASARSRWPRLSGRSRGAGCSCTRTTPATSSGARSRRRRARHRRAAHSRTSRSSFITPPHRPHGPALMTSCVREKRRSRRASARSRVTSSGALRSAARAQQDMQCHAPGCVRSAVRAWSSKLVPLVVITLRAAQTMTTIRSPDPPAAGAPAGWSGRGLLRF